MTPLEIALAGAVGGFVAALALTPLVPLSRYLLGAHREPRRATPIPGAGPVLSEAPRFPPDLLAVTAVFVQKVATGIFGVSLPVAEQRALGTAWHLAYGAVWGTGLALLLTSLRVPGLLLGAGYGVLVWLAGPAWLVPRMRLVPRPLHHPPLVRILILAWHVAYGLITALVIVTWTGRP